MVRHNKIRPVWQQQGFSLIELLVVVVIVSILFTYTTLAIRGTSPEELIKEEARRLTRLVQLASEEAILRGEEYGIEVFVDGYRFLRQSDGKWFAFEGDKILRERELPSDMEIELQTEETDIEISNLTSSAIAKYLDQTSALEAALADTTLGDDDDEEGGEESKVKPQIYLLSNGEITPEFKIRFYILGVEASYLVNGKFDGELTTQASEL
ncbi:MAG: type II secretion system protein GspH [Thiotrichaceae bacterium]|nr:MAG: type II secretion system protein GspH [Thiotrichaceae bacterium]